MLVTSLSSMGHPWYDGIVYAMVYMFMWPHFWCLLVRVAVRPSSSAKRALQWWVECEGGWLHSTCVHESRSGVRCNTAGSDFLLSNIKPCLIL